LGGRESEVVNRGGLIRENGENRGELDLICLAFGVAFVAVFGVVDVACNTFIQVIVVHVVLGVTSTRHTSEVLVVFRVNVTCFTIVL